MPDTADVPVRDRSAAELELRRDLAACYRLVAHFGWDDLVANHISVRLPGTPEAFLLNPFGLMFDEITASSLVKVDMEGRLLEETPYSINQAGYVIHSAVHAARPDALCVIHLHTRDGVAVSMTEDGLLPLNQSAMLIADDVAFHEYEGPALDVEERGRLQADLGDRNLMILRNHGTLAVGRSVAEAFNRLYFLEWCCTVQVRALSMGRPLHHPVPREGKTAFRPSARTPCATTPRTAAGPRCCARWTGSTPATGISGGAGRPLAPVG